MGDSPQQKRVVILGGGCGAIATAFWLTSTKKLREHYKVSIYTHGWRLGGKAASGRDAAHGHAIQEHGLHILMGWYEIAFKSIRACYDEWQKEPDNPFKSWKSAFTPLKQVTLTQQLPNNSTGQWNFWNMKFPRNRHTPGEPAGDLTLLAVPTILGWLRKHLWSDTTPAGEIQTAGLKSLTAMHKKARRALKHPNESTEIYRSLAISMEQFQRWFLELAQPQLFSTGSRGEETCAFTDYAIALMRGYIRDVFPHWDKGIEALNKIEYRDWLRSAGASEKYLGFAPVRVLYDLAFAYENGNSSTIDNGRIAAGSGLRALLMMTLAYKGAPLWKMNAGMGDTIFSPMYSVLKKRGVDIHFFHRVTNIHPSKDGRSIESISMYRQVNLTSPSYPPFRKVKGFPCWPSEPKWDEIVGGEVKDAWDLESMWCTYRVPGPDIELRVNKDFDQVVLAIPPASLPLLGRELLDSNTSIRSMYENMQWVATLASQLWLSPKLPDLGWKLGPTVLSTYADPFRSWGEMSHLISMEYWATPKPRSIEYFCGTFDTPRGAPPYNGLNFPKTQEAIVKRAFASWLGNNIVKLWPLAGTASGGFNTNLLLHEFYRANVDPSEMYVQTFPNSVEHRLSPADTAVTGIENLYFAGDWTKGNVNGGCAEGAFESGKMAAEAIAKEALDIPLV
jgi:uncharacterized protein with NAD-binding domain and iron-sulfur cluster